MRLHSSRVPEIARQMLQALMDSGDIETQSPREVQLDLESVMTQYINDEQELSERARDMVAARGLPASELGKLRRLFAKERRIGIDDDAIDYLLDQLVNMLMYSNHVDEVFAEDVKLRLLMRTPLRKELEQEKELEEAVRGQLKHVQEGSSVWEVEYQRMKHDMKRRRGL